jgi:putative membrane protein
MINYDGKNWLESVRHFNTSYVIRRTLRMTLTMGVYAGVIFGCEMIFQLHPELVPLNLHVFQIEPAVFSLLGILLSLLLVFRTNTAYDRWWEGRKQWGALINQTRGLAVLWNGMLMTNERPAREFWAKSISAYVLSLSEHLRGHEQHDLIGQYSDEAPKYYEKLAHVPNKIVNDMYQFTESMYRDGFIDGFQLNQVQPRIQAFLDIQGACERIKATPIPFAHNFFIKLFVLTYCALLPFVLVPLIGWVAIILTMFVAYALVGIEYIGVEIEEPFGLDCNDLPTHNLARKIEANVHEILEVDLVQPDAEQKQSYLVIN